MRTHNNTISDDVLNLETEIDNLKIEIKELKTHGKEPYATYYKKLARIREIAHNGGLEKMSISEALQEIRKITKVI